MNPDYVTCMLLEKAEKFRREESEKWDDLRDTLNDIVIAGDRFVTAVSLELEFAAPFVKSY